MQNKRQPVLMGWVVVVGGQWGYACQNQEGNQIGMQAPPRTDSRRRRQPLFNNSHNKTQPSLPAAHQSLSASQKLDVIQIFSLFLFQHTRRGEGWGTRGRVWGCKIALCSHASGFVPDPPSETLTAPHLWLHLSRFYLWVACKLILRSVPSGLRHRGVLLYFNIAKQDC